MGLITKFRDTLNKNIAGAVLSTGLGLLTLANAPTAKAQSFEKQSAVTDYAWIVPSAADADGANGAKWRTYLRGRVPEGSDVASIQLIAHPRGEPAGENDPSFTFTRNPGEAFEFDNLVGTVARAKGAYWLEIMSNVNLTLANSITGNVSATGAFQGADMPTIPRATLTTDPRITQAGDLREFVLGDPATKRFSYIVHNASDNPATIDLELVSFGGATTNTASVTVPGHTTAQWFVTDLVGAPADTAYTLRTKNYATNQNTETFLAEFVSETDNVVTTSQDPVIYTGNVRPLIEKLEYTLTPSANLEVNDPLVLHVRANMRANTRVDYFTVSIQNPENYAYGPGSTNTNDLNYNVTTTADTATTWTPRVKLTLADETGRNHIRRLTGDTIESIAEKDGYVATAADVKGYVLPNLSWASAVASKGGWGGFNFLTSTQWQSMWTEYLDGTATIGNKELQQLIFGDRGNGTTGGNTIQFKFTDGTATTLYNLPEQPFDGLRRNCKATQPQ